MNRERVRAQLMAVAWPAFLMASVLEMLVFAVVDPVSLHDLDGAQLGLTALTVYSVAFMVFWLVIAAAGMLVLVLTRTPHEVNTQTFKR